MKPEFKNSLKYFLKELAVYALLVIVYYALVLRALGGWLEDLSKTDRRVYAGVALGLIVGQGVVLEMLTRFLLRLIAPRTEEP